MGRGQPTSRPSNYVISLEILLADKNDRIAELEAKLERIDAVIREFEVDGREAKISCSYRVREALKDTD